MTATPLRTDGQNMIEKRCGKVAYELKISDAVARGILKLPVYITSRYIFEEDIKNIEAKIEQIEDEKVRQKLEKKLKNAKKQLVSAEGLKDILSKHIEKNGKYLVFCNIGDNLEDIIKKAMKEGWFDTINEDQTLLSVESSKKDSENAMALRKFARRKSKDLRILFSKNMLNEGIHDEEITGEIMMRPTRSYILFVQQLGRILSRDRKDSPIVLDLVCNIHYFKEFQLEIQRIIKEAEARGDKRYDPKVLEQFRIIEEQEDFIKAFEEIENSIEGYLNKTAVSETLEVARILKENGVDLRKIQSTRVRNGKKQNILLQEISQEGIDVGRIIKEYGLDDKFPYGQRICNLRRAYRGNGGLVITEEEKREAETLGLVSNKSMVAETLEVARVLKKNGVDLTKIQLGSIKNGKHQFITLQEIEQEGIDIGRIIKEYGLDDKFHYGQRICSLRQAYKGNLRIAITEEEKREAETLGLVSNKSMVAETLEVARVLKKNGVDLTKIQLSSIKNGKQQFITLQEIEQEGIDIGRIIKEYGLDYKFPYGKRISSLRQAYKGNLRIAITEEEKREAETLGLVSNKSMVAETLEVARILKKNGVDLTKIQLRSMRNGKQQLIMLQEIEQEGIDIGRIIKEHGLDDKFHYGQRISNLRQAYRGSGRSVITEEEKREAEKLGIIQKRIKLLGQDIGQASFEAPVEKCDEAQAVLDRLVQQEKEGEIEQSE